MQILLLFLGFSIYQNSNTNNHKEYNQMKEVKTDEFNFLEDDFIYPSDQCQNVDIKEDTYSIFNCNFNDCIETEYVISFTKNNGKLNIIDSTFQFSEQHKPASILYVTSPSVYLFNNSFIKCGKNTIYFKPSKYIQFQLIENRFSECKEGTIVHFESDETYISPPQIENNTFEKVSLTEPSFSLKIGYGLQINFENDTFRGFEMNCDQGGIGIECKNILDIIALYFHNCTFINNTNKKVENGGAFHGYFETGGDSILYFSGCNFEENNAKGNGGAISMNTKKTVSISDCFFKGNKAGLKGGAIHVEPYNDRKNYASITISKCIFLDNKAELEGGSVFIFISDSPSKTIFIADCTVQNGGISIVDYPTCRITISGTKFMNIDQETSLFVNQTLISSNPFRLTNCLFANVTKNADSFACFNLSLMTNSLTLEENVIRNVKINSPNVYIGCINVHDRTNELSITKWSFISNTCNSLYGGGGVSTLFDGIESLRFDSCNFINNNAKQDKSISRHLSDSSKSYFNGDGGAIQLGYLCSLCDFDVTFENCTFSSNKADRHGGAIAIQTLQKVTILKCSFNDNVADCMNNYQSNLLADDYYDLKKEGRGGAIYINPTFSYDCHLLFSFMTLVNIEECTFDSNTAFDGYAIYIEGEDEGTKFTIRNNDFHDNFNKQSDLQGAVIASEIEYLYQNVSYENSFSYSNQQSIPKPFSFVDHNGQGLKTPEPEKKKKISTKIIIAIVCGCIAFVLVVASIIIIITLYMRKKKKNIILSEKETPINPNENEMI